MSSSSRRSRPTAAAAPTAGCVPRAGLRAGGPGADWAPASQPPPSPPRIGASPPSRRPSIFIVGADLGGVAVLAALVLPLAGAQAALDVPGCPCAGTGRRSRRACRRRRRGAIRWPRGARQCSCPARSRWWPGGCCNRVAGGRSGFPDRRRVADQDHFIDGCHPDLLCMRLPAASGVPAVVW